MSWTNGVDQYLFDFGNLAALPDSVVEEMLQAEGEVIRRAQSSTASSMLQGRYNKGAVARAAKVGKVKRTSYGHACYVTFPGTQHGNRIAEIAFVNEYGKNGQTARPFVRTANEKYCDEAVDAACKVYDRFLEKLGF